MSTDSVRSAGVAAVVSAKEVRAALEDGAFVLHFQPIVDLESAQPHGVEALIRWHHPVRGLLAPDAFLPAIAQTPVMASVTRWVLAEACSAAAHWPGWSVSVNVAARDLAGDALLGSVLDALDAASLPPERLVLELTETALVQDMARAADVLGQLRREGVGVALDDFGTGYSSMLYLRELPVTSVKIDRVFVAGLGHDGDDRAIVTSLLTLARTVGLTAVAEGVETNAQARQLHALGCPFGQGFLWSRAVPAEALENIHRDGLPTTGRRQPRSQTRSRPTADSGAAARANELLARGASLHTIAAALNAAGERTAQGTLWRATSVARLISSKRPWSPPKS
jgi:EAL domain-containing protein (putative c-di-GMP-specific phosphodiesterase class I)